MISMLILEIVKFVKVLVFHVFIYIIIIYYQIPNFKYQYLRNFGERFVIFAVFIDTKLIEEDFKIIAGTCDQRSTSIGNNLASALADTINFLSIDEDLGGFNSPVVFADDREIMDVTFEEALVNTTENELRVLGSFNLIEIEREDVVIKSLLLHDAIEEGVHVVSSHIRVSKTNNTIESRLK